MVTFETDALRISIGADGRVTSLEGKATGEEYLREPAPLLVVRSGGQEHAPDSAAYDEAAGMMLILKYDAPGISVGLQVLPTATHIGLTCISVDGPAPEMILWGSYPTTVADIIGETIGVVRNGEVALGIQGLNAKTIGGADGSTEQGSRLFAYTYEREGGALASAIALFACPVEEALATIGKIEVATGLPHPMLDGVWGKVSPRATESYMIAPFGEGNIEGILARAKQAGFRYLYHPGPFRTWGHFELEPGQFPRGDESLRVCGETAAAQGMRLGIHTLTAFITTNDPYVTPVPDPRLARWGTTTLAAAVDAWATEIPITDAAAFERQGALKSALIGEEIVQYASVSEAGVLTGCKRGAFGTTASTHGAGADIGDLADHGYRTLYPGIENGMWEELADRLVELCNVGGIRQISFDGLEGLSSYGHHEWARNIFVERCYEGWENETISDASNLLHYLWHIHTRMNWGEPWGHATRDGMPEYRFKNQAYFDRNLFPRMLGWFQLRLAAGNVPATSVDDIEWVLSKCAAYGAGFALATSLGEVGGNGQSAAILDAVREWEAARMAGAFTSEQQEKLKAAGSEWHLESAGEGGWRLTPVTLARFTCSSEALQPGQPAENLWELTNPYAEQPLHLTLRVPHDAATPVEAPTVSIGGTELAFRTTLGAGQYLVCDGTPEATVYDANWNELATAEADAEPPLVRAGTQEVGFVVPMMMGAAPSVEVGVGVVVVVGE